MDKRTKKRLEALRNRLQKLKQQLAGARRQQDDPREAAELQRQIETTAAEIEQFQRLAN